MREPGSDGNLNVMFFQKISDNILMTLLTKGEEGQSTVRSIVHHFTWNLLENMTNRFPHIPDFVWISHALPCKYVVYVIKILFSQYIYILLKSLLINI